MEHQAFGFGETLRRRREQRGLSLNDVAVRTRVRKAYLQALEEENLAALPGSAYAIGFLRIYARYLDLAAEPLVAALTGKSMPDGERRALPGGEGSVAVPARRARRPKLMPVLVALLLLALAGGGYLFYLQGQSGVPVEITPAAPVVEPPVPPVPVPTAPQTQTPAPAPADAASPAPETVLPVIPPEGAIVRVVAAGAGVVKVTLDGQDSRDYQLQPEQKLNWKVGKQLLLELSAPSLLRCWVNDQEVALAELVAVRLVGVAPPDPSRQ